MLSDAEIVSLAEKVVSVLSRGQKRKDRDELISDATLAIFKAVKGGELRQGHLYTIGKQAVTNGRRKEEKYRKRFEAYEPEVIANTEEGNDIPPEDPVEHEDELAVILSRLDDDEIELCRLRREGLTHEEIASKLGVSRRTVINRLQEVECKVRNNPAY